MEIRPIFSALLRNKTGAILVAVQVAISMAILANALHIVNVRQAVQARPSGIADESTVLHLTIRNLTRGGHEEQLATQKREADTLRAVSGVISVAQVSQIPLSDNGSTNSVSVDRKQVNSTADASFYVTPDSLVKTWGLKLVEGRDFAPADVMEIDQQASTAFPDKVIVTRALAEKMFPGAASVVGKVMYFGTGEGANEVRIIGVVERLQSQGAQVAIESEYSTIVPVRLSGNIVNVYTIRTEPGQLERVAREAEAALRAASATPVIVKTKTMDATRRDRYKGDRTMSWMLVVVSGLLLLITASGIVGIASLWVTQRRKQIGVRRALGARKVDILRYFLTENFMITTAGIVAGVLMAIGLNQLLVTKLEMDRLPIAYLVAGSCVFWALGVLAVYGPAWRAASISPALATRSA
ncbi:MAG TPA: FtsX-like permease family protein [Telluria sp.]|nr:FtsX-like permease family protein [Telluria sp.]